MGRPVGGRAHLFGTTTEIPAPNPPTDPVRRFEHLNINARVAEVQGGVEAGQTRAHHNDIRIAVSHGPFFGLR